MLKVGSKFYTFDDLSRRLEEFQEIEQVQLWVRDSRTVVAAAKRARRKSLNPALKYAELTYSCVFGGRRPSDQAKTHNQTSAGGCPFKVRLSTSNDGQALVVKEICHDHNHEPGKKLHEEPRRLYKNKANNRAGVRKPVRYLVNKQRTSSASSTVTCLSPKTRLPQPDSSTTIRLAQSPFHHLQLHSQQQQQQIKLQLEQHLQQQRIRQQQLDVVQLDSPDHIDTPDHLSSPDLSSSFEQLGNIITTTDQYSYLPPSPISPSSLSSSGQTGYSSEEEESVEPILDLDVALEEALGDLDSVSSMDLEDKFALHPLGARTSVSRGSDCEPSLSAVPLAASPSTSATASHHHSEDPCAPPPAKRFRGRPRKQSFTAGNAKSDDENETDFIGFSPVKTLDSAKGEQINEIDIAEADAMAKQLHVYKLGITFVPGAKLEVLDSRDNNWYQCKVVEVDWGELDILVHFERWSVRYDEWLKMDSTRIRPLSRSKEKGKPLTFKIGEKVLGYWAPDSKYYLGQITKHSSEDYYEVLFYDGYTKSLRTSQLRKIANPKQYSGIDIKASPKHLRHLPPSAGSVVVPAPAAAIADVDSTKARRKSVPAVPFESPPVSPASAIPKEQSEAGPVAEAFNLNIKRNIFDVEILEKKRKTKRKPDVEQVFKSIKKKRKLEEMTEAESQSFPIKTLSPSKSKVKLVKKEASLTEEAAAPPPRSLESQIFPNSEGMPSKSCNYFEVDIGHGWKKVCNRRTHGIWMGKWDVFFIASDGRKLRNRQELIKYCEENPGPLKPSDLDFSVRSAKQIYDATRSKQDSQIRQEIQSDEEMETKPSTLKSPAVQTVDDDEDYDDEDLPDDGDDMVVSSSSDESDESADSEQKVSVKDVVKKRQTSSSESDTELESSPEKQDVSSVKLSQLLSETMKKDATHYKVEAKPSVISPVKDTSSPTVCPPSETKLPVISRGPKKEKKECTSIVKSEIPSKSDHSHKCPSKSCEKSFRKENLLQMHMKHYHPEFLKRRSLQAPNVADLAYARTVGDHLDVASQSPSSIAFPPIDFMIPEKKTEVVKKTKSSEQKKIVEKKGGGKRLKDGKRDKSLQDEASDSDEGDNNGEELTTEAKEEEDSTCVGKSEAHRPDPNLIPKTKPSRRFQRERTVSRSETTKRRSRKSESMSEDDPVEKKLVKIRSSKRKSSSGLKTHVASSSDGQSESIDPDEENTETWTEAPTEDYQDAIIHCGCNSQEEDGLMLQCDVCLTWQHGNCYNIESEDQVPEKYICFLCENPKGQRSSMRFRHHQEWLKEGKLPRFSFSTSEPNVKLESCIRRGHELSANVLQLSQLIYSLRLKLNIAKEADHPKFVMWHKKWEEPNDDLVDTENKLSDSKSNQNVTDHQLAPIHELISSLSQSETQPESQISYQAQTKSTTISFSAEPASSAPVSTTSKGDSAMSEILETIGVSRIDDVSALVEREKILKEEPLPSKESNTPETKSSEGSSNDSAKNQIASLPSPKHETTNLKLELTEELPKSTKTEPNEKEEPLNVETSKKEHRTDNKGEIHKQLLEHVVPSDLKTAEEDPSIKEVKSNVAKQQGKKELDHNFPSKVSEGDLSVKDSSSAGENNDKVSEPSKASGNAEITTLSKDEKVELIKKETDIPLEQRKVEKTEDSLKVVDGGSQDSLEDPEDLALALGALGAGAETNINDGLVDLLSSNPEFVEQLVVGSELAPLVPNNVNVQPVPIIPKNERIEPVNCKLNLLQHVDVLQNKVMKRFDYIEDQLKALEAEMNLSSEISREEEELLASDGDEGRDPVTLQARALVKLILNDLDTVKRISDFSDS